jgi:DNA polymerase-1
VTEKLLTLIPRPDSLQNPDLGKQYQVRLRELFIPDEGHVMIGADYRGLEVGMAAYLTSDSQLIADYNSNLDTHSVVAIQAFDLPIEVEPRETLKKRVQAEHAYERELAKRGTFTWLYGGSEKALVDQLKIPFELAYQILKTLSKRYSGVARWQEAVQQTVLRQGQITTPWGRTRRFQIHDSMDQRLIDDQLREAINAPNQSMSSDMNLAAFAAVEAMGIETLFPFHDAIYAQAPEDQAERVAKRIRHAMETTLAGPVLFEADVKTGPNWAELG